LIFDASYRAVYATEDYRKTVSGLNGLGPFPMGAFHFSSESKLVISNQLLFGSQGLFESQYREDFEHNFGVLLEIFGGDRELLRAASDPLVHDLIDSLPEIAPTPAYAFQQTKTHSWGLRMGNRLAQLEVAGHAGERIGFVRLTLPASGMAAAGHLISTVDVRHLQRIQEIMTADRRPAAILFADVEASSRLSRSLSTSEYFALARRLVRAADQCVVDAGGVVGRHLGDGVTTFFLAEVLGGESAAARACIEAARSLRAATPAIAVRSGLEPGDLVLRFGLHWGSTLYVGLFKSVARSEVTAMGDEVNEAARIEACAKGGKTLASKSLIERLSRSDAAALEIDAVSYRMLGDLEFATDKALMDAPLMPVCEV